MSTPVPSCSDSIPIATCTAHSITQFVSYDGLSPSFHAFISYVSTTSIPKFVLATLSIPQWRQVIIDEITTLHDSGTLVVVSSSFR